MPLFHSTRNRHKPGEIILPGNFGRIINDAGPKHYLYFREMKIEAFRAAHYPEKPSRLKATFHTDNIETATAYRDSRAPGDFIYEVEMVDPAANTHRACVHAIQAYPGWPEEAVFNGYWTGELWFTVDEYPGVVWAEYVSTSPLRVIKRIRRKNHSAASRTGAASTPHSRGGR